MTSVNRGERSAPSLCLLWAPSPVRVTQVSSPASSKTPLLQSALLGPLHGLISCSVCPSHQHLGCSSVCHVKTTQHQLPPFSHSRPTSWKCTHLLAFLPRPDFFLNPGSVASVPATFLKCPSPSTPQILLVAKSNISSLWPCLSILPHSFPCFSGHSALGLAYPLAASSQSPS